MEEALAPGVVAVVVTRDPGPWFDETLAALSRQTYEELSVLVMVSGGDVDPTERVAAQVPGAFVRRLPEDRGFGYAVNEALSMVDGAAFFLLCHDDCAPDENAVHVLVEESFRSNAAIVSPKVVRWDDPSVLVHVGMSADKTGAMIDRVHEGEIDHGQHDAVRDVFVAPGGCTLVRADLLRELGGFDTAMVAMGEDLDLCWRAHVAGARVVVAPEARVRHLELVAGGARGVAAGAGAEGVSLQALQRRNELRAMLKCYGPLQRWRVGVVTAVLLVAELVVSVAVRDRTRARALAGACRWNFAHRRELRELRRAVQAHRVLRDREVRQLMTPGATRLSTYLTRLTHHGFDVAHGLVPAHAAGSREDLDDGPQLTGSVGLAFSEDSTFDELDDMGRRAGRDRFGRRRRKPFLGSHRGRLVAYGVAAIVLLVGTRGLLGQAFPVVGQLAPLGTWGSVWHQLFAGWQSPGVGTTAPATPAFAVLGLTGTLLFGAMGTLQKVLVLGCIPLGAWGVLRLLRPLAAGRARLAGGLAYLGLSLSYDALAQGRWDGLVAFGVTPFLVKRLAVAGGMAPFGPPPGRVVDLRWWLRNVAALGLIEAVAVSFAPAVAPMVLVVAVGIVIGSALVGSWRGAARTAAAAVAGAVVAAVLCAPWLVGTLAAGRRAVGVFGLASAAGTGPGWSDLLTFRVGPVGHSPLGWLLVLAALLPLLIGRGERLAWAARLWVVASGSWVLALAVARGWTGSFSPQLTVVLAPAAVAVAAGVGLGVAAFDTDLSEFRFGWRQLVSALAVLAAAVGLVPVVVSAAGGRWDVPTAGYEQALGFMDHPASSGPGRVLWLGDPSVLPTGGWSVRPGYAFATSEQGLPQPVDVWSPAGAGPSTALERAVDLAVSGQTRDLGMLLAPGAVRYVVVVWSLAPGGDAPPGDAALAPPTGLLDALQQQGDLVMVPGGSGYAVFENTDFVPERAARPGGPVTAAGYPPVAPVPGDLTGWRPVLAGAPGSRAFSGTVPSGTVLASYAPAARWHLEVDGRPQAARPAFGWAAQYSPARGGRATLAFSGSPLTPLCVGAEVLLWLALAALLVVPWQRGRRRREREAPPGGETVEVTATVPAPRAPGAAPASLVPAGERAR